MKLQLQAAQPREASNGHTTHLASFFQFIFVTPQVYLLCPTTVCKNSLRKDNKGQDDSFIASEMAFKEWYETPNNSVGAAKRNVLFAEK